MCIFYDTFESPVGKLFVAASHDGLCAIYMDKDDGLLRLRKDFKGGEFEHNPGKVKSHIKQLQDFFSGKSKRFDVKFDIGGTPFQKKVWKVLQAIPYGRTITYAELARRAGSPRASRAAGSACGSNPIPFIIPCHRVIGSNGSLGGFGLGLSVKKYLLALEQGGAQAVASAA